LGVVEKSVTLADNVLNIGEDTVNKLKYEKNNFNDVVSNFNSLINKANAEFSIGLDSVDQKYCAWSGGQTLAVANAVCTFKDGKKCLTETFYNGKCSPEP
jgi:putative hemolysin